MNNNPLVTVALFSFNQKDFIVEAVRSVLDQDYSPLQIIVSDDCSSDATYSLAQWVVDKYDGSHQIVLNRNEKNLGIGGHINRIMELADGEFIVAAGGDDISLPNRVSAFVDAWMSTGQKYHSMCSDMLVINKEGEFAFELPRMKSVSFDNVLKSPERWMNGASHVWHKSIFEIFGPLRMDVVSEDKVIGFRSLLLGQKIGYMDMPLVKYRCHSASVTGGSSNLKTLQQKISTFRSYIQDFDKAKALGYLKDKKDIERIYEEFVKIHDDFAMRYEILNSSLIKSVFKIFTCGKTLSAQQKRNLFLKKIQGQEKKVGW